MHFRFFASFLISPRQIDRPLVPYDDGSTRSDPEATLRLLRLLSRRVPSRRNDERLPRRSYFARCRSRSCQDPARLVRIRSQITFPLADSTSNPYHSGGGSSGLMGQLASSSLDAGGHVVGIIPSAVSFSLCSPSSPLSSHLRTASSLRLRPANLERIRPKQKYKRQDIALNSIIKSKLPQCTSAR